MAYILDGFEVAMPIQTIKMKRTANMDDHGLTPKKKSQNVLFLRHDKATRWRRWEACGQHGRRK